MYLLSKSASISSASRTPQLPYFSILSHGNVEIVLEKANVWVGMLINPLGTKRNVQKRFQIQTMLESIRQNQQHQQHQRRSRKDN